VSSLLASQWGLAGTIGLTILLLCLLLPAREELRPSRDDRTAGMMRDAVVLFGVLLLASIVLPAPFDAALVLLTSLALLGAVAYPAAGPAGTTAIAEDAQDGGDASAPLRFWPLVSALALTVFACSSLYMVLANYGLVFFTGKNVYLLGLDSVSDALEGLVLLALGAAGWVAAQRPTVSTLAPAPQPLSLPRRPGRALQRGKPVPMP
jgi:hypothetical protein